MFSVIGIVIGGFLVVVMYKLLLTTTLLSFVVVEAIHKLKVKIQLAIISTVVNLLLCLIIAAIVVQVECKETECSGGYSVGKSAAFIVPGALLQILSVLVVVHLFIRCCYKDKDGVKKMEEDNMPDNVSYHGQKSGRSTVTPSAIDLGTHGTYSKNQVFMDSDHFVSSDDLKKTRSWSPRSDASDDLKTKRNYVAKLGKPGNQPTETRTHNELSKTSFDLNPDRTFKSRINSDQTKNTHNTDSAISNIDSSKKLNEAGDSGYTSRNAPDSGRSMSSLNSNTANQNNLKASENLKNINSAGKTETKSKEAHSDSESETGTESSEDDLQPGNEKKMQEHIWSISGRHIESNMAVTTNGHVNSFKSNDQSKVTVMPDDLSQYIISVPTGDGVKEVMSEATSSDDDDDEDTVPNKDDKTSDKKSTKKKGSKKTKWRKKKKTLVVPEHAENTEKAKSENKKPKSKAKKKKKKRIIV